MDRNKDPHIKDLDSAIKNFMQTAKDFMAKNPNVEIKVQLVADADMPTKVRTALTG